MPEWDRDDELAAPLNERSHGLSSEDEWSQVLCMQVNGILGTAVCGNVLCAHVHAVAMDVYKLSVYTLQGSNTVPP